MRGIDKSFPGVRAARSVDLEVGEGEIHGLVGENGAGKSTLIKILAGAYGTPARSYQRRDRRCGRSQRDDRPRGGGDLPEPSLAPNLSVAENIFMGRLPTSRFGIVDRRRLATDTTTVAERLGLDLDPGARVGSLSVARRQMVEIAKALSRDARLIVLDEPSAVLAEAELDGLIRVMRRLAEKGVAFIYISHRLNEVFRITDRVTVMNDQVVATERTAAMDPDQLVRLMVGRELGAIYGSRLDRPPGEVALELTGLTRLGAFADIDLRVRAGEIRASPALPGPAGPRSYRRSMAPDPIDGEDGPCLRGEVAIRSPRDAIAHGIGLLAETIRPMACCCSRRSASTSRSRAWPSSSVGVIRLPASAARSTDTSSGSRSARRARGRGCATSPAATSRR